MRKFKLLYYSFFDVFLTISQGFGAGNFKTLFESIELEQEKRGNL